MTEPDQGPANPARRRVLAGFLTAYTASLVPWALAQPVAAPEHGAFMALSALLAGRRSLDAGLAARLFDALSAMYPHFTADARALLAQINQQHIDPAQLQSTLDGAHSPLAPLPRRIMRAWCLGLVGEGEATKCVAYENALNAVIVADVLKPPTYAYGEYGSWAKPPLAEGVNAS
ncbi:MAG: hypothetical protein EPN36_13010 [Rhodanobacteraceae bacterium]|nr:MAG: hypothetical protein EPN36_13010 [Rhodanobacteraceae bacterium]